MVFCGSALSNEEKVSLKVVYFQWLSLFAIFIFLMFFFLGEWILYLLKFMVYDIFLLIRRCRYFWSIMQALLVQLWLNSGPQMLLM